VPHELAPRLVRSDWVCKTANKPNDSVKPAMITLVHHHAKRPSFYRVDVGYNLFGEYSVVREWGGNGPNGAHRIAWFSNLRDAAQVADRWHMKACAKGYALTERVVAG